MPLVLISRMIGATFSAKRRACSAVRPAPVLPASARLTGLPKRAPWRLRTAGALRVRSEIMRRSFSASAA